MKKIVLFGFTIFQILVILWFVTTCAKSEEMEINEIKTILHKFKEEYGYAPTDHDFFSIILKPEYSFSYEEISILYQILKQKSAPIISKDKLLKIIKAKRESIKDFYCQYKVRVNNANNNISIYTTESKYVKKDNKILFDQIIQEGSTLLPRNIISYDGHLFYNYSPPSQEHVMPFVGVKENVDYSLFYDSFLPLTISMLVDSKQFGKTFDYINDLIVFLEDGGTIGCEKKEIIDGKECLVFCNWYTRVWLCPDLDFMPVRAEAYFLSEQESTKSTKVILTKRELIEKKLLFNLRNYGNGIWLPSHIKIEFFTKDGIPIKNVFIDVSSMKVNTAIKDENFTDFIPKGAIIADTSRNMVYQWEDHPSIGGLLKETVKPKSTRLYQRISVITGLIMIVIAVVFEIRKRILQRRAS
jgi:hypothetical protein